MPSLACLLASIYCRSTDAAEYVFSSGHNFHVGRIDAWPISADVVDRQVFRDWFYESFVGETMGHDLHAVALTTANVVLPVTTGLKNRAAPFPAISVGMDAKLRQKTGWEITHIHVGKLMRSED